LIPSEIQGPKKYTFTYMEPIHTRRYILILFPAMLMLTHCKSKVEPFRWLIGTWEMHRAAGGSRFEIWAPKNDFTLSGEGLRIEGTDTFLLEKIELVMKNDNFYYIPTIPDQNNAQPISFELKKTEGTVYTFENPGHDFPQRIIYRFKPADPDADLIPSAKDSLLVRVESLDGEGIDYGFSRQ
jgi:hypothetical protein